MLGKRSDITQQDHECAAQPENNEMQYLTNIEYLSYWLHVVSREKPKTVCLQLCNATFQKLNY